MKRILTAAICLISCAILMLSALAPNAALAEDIAKFEMNDVNDAAVGSEFDVTLSLSGSYKIHTVNMTIAFDPNALELVNVENGKLLAESVVKSSGYYILEHESIAAQGYIKLAIAMPIDALSANGDLFKMTFKVRENVKVNQQIVLNIYELAYMPLGAKVGTPISFETVNSIVSIDGASDPEGGFNRGESGTPNPSLTQIPTLQEGTLSPNMSRHPVVTVPPADEGNTENDRNDSVSTFPPTATAAPSDKQNEGGVKPVVYVLGGVVVAAAVAAVTVIVRKKKSDTTQD